MFTGIVTDIGEIIELEQRGDLRARIKTAYPTADIALGASIACDGVCLTVIELGDDWFEVEISAETISKTIIGYPGQNRKSVAWHIGRNVNLERALRVGDELGGHIVSGHVDGVAQIVQLEVVGDSTEVLLEAPKELAKYIAIKGSVTLNGTSLTVNKVDGNCFGINFIPHTKTVTTWGQMELGDAVNIEVDTLARYVDRLHAAL
ncbi:MAG: riboflavin synthase [Paracoccaceae bacterium]